ncbi:hypothetical protein N7466_008255 [Penicillium verhagenii]|uniref:uncharacterized protein n=1 Tax=Penicillium verhagenii TaxID=1562060 RepID=UPI00254539AA|nr:uncharacterized protein N7466_008255 [Penicillium verhagenii]KAJ5924068.1 hypothetical protein N7466_008255 [Penicillium verhagenii]
MARQEAPYGKWVPSESISGGNFSLQGVQANPSTGKIYALESRAAEGGRYTIVEISDSTTREILPAEYSAKGTIHEYGGGSLAMYPNGKLIFTNYPTNGVFLLDPQSGTVENIVSPDASNRFSDFHVYPPTQEWILAVQETHETNESSEPIVTNTVVAIHAATGDVNFVAKGADFYSHPKFSPDGKQVSWVEWNHPDMPWTGSVLHLAPWEPGKLLDSTVVAGQAGVESICQPRWRLDGTLFFVSDRTGYWQLYRFDGKASHHIQLEGLGLGEFGSREPLLGSCTYILMDEKTIVASVIQNATSNLIRIDLESNSWKDLSIDLVDILRNALACVSPTSFAVIGSTRTVPQALYHVELSDGVSVNAIRATVKKPISESLISQARHVTFPRTYSNTSDKGHALFVPPKNPEFEAPAGTLPPLIVWMHGGPVGHVTPELDFKTQYWTSRGYAYVLVNHVGSTGYGRAYRALLDGAWGEAEIADAASCVSYLALEGVIDVTKVGIVGESAGGYSVMQALYTYPDIWAAGISLYGISSLQGFAELTHKFESHYILGLVLGKGEWSDEARQARYRKRSALYHTEKIKAPLLLLQGDIDTVVPVSQATEMEEAMKKSGKEVELVVFEGEGHGWRKGETIRASTQLETKFWAANLL